MKAFEYLKASALQWSDRKIRALQHTRDQIAAAQNRCDLFQAVIRESKLPDELNREHELNMSIINLRYEGDD